MSAPRPDGTAGHGTAPGLTGSIFQASIAQPDTALKKHRVVLALLGGPLHRFQAERFPISDHALPSTISELKRDGLKISSARIALAGYGGKTAHLAEYHLAEESRELALRMIRCR